MSARVHFLEAQLSLIHIPLDQYQHYLPSVLQLLFPSAARPNGDVHNSGSWANGHAFLNVSVTSIECSIVCGKDVAECLFRPVIDQAVSSPGADGDHYASISVEDFVVISVEGAGMEAGQRVLELTSPLALAGISLFFITTYYSDFILVPEKAKCQVVRALESRGFAFEQSSESYVNASAHNRNASSSSSLGSGIPSTPPPTNMTELQARTFGLLNRHSIVPIVHSEIRLVQCGGRNTNPETFVADELALQHGLTKCLIYQPNFLSVTLTRDESAGLLLEKRLLPNFDLAGSDNVLLGATEDYLIPIVLNLESLPIEASGIVCGVAGRLVDGPLHPIEMTYLSTAKAGTVMVDECDLDSAMQALRLGVNGEIQP